MNKVTLEKWHEDEKAWWDKHGNFMSYQWRLTPELNKILRFSLESDYTKYLLKKNSKLLDLGCGSGWLSLYFAKEGMDVVGIDISSQQINDANILKKAEGVSNLDFICDDFSTLDLSHFDGKFDRVFINAFLHHLRDDELELIFIKINNLLKVGGKVFLYEPLSCSLADRSFAIKVIDFLVNVSSDVAIRRIPSTLGLYDPIYLSAAQEGYTMSSPHERPINVEFLNKCIAGKFMVEEIRPIHLYSMGFAMQSMNIRESTRGWYRLLTKILFFIDQLFFKIFGWKKFSYPGRFILCSIKMTKVL